MQSGYGEMQQFMVDASLFSSPSNAPPPPNPEEIHNHHPLSHPPPSPPPHFAHFGHPVPITQRLFQQQQTHVHHQFQLFHHNHHLHQQQHMRLDQGLEPENPRGAASFLEAMNFKLGVSDQSSGGGGGSRDDRLNDDDGIPHGGDDDGSDESRLHHHHPWHRDDDQAAPNIKQPFWRPLDLDIDFFNPNNKRPSKDKQPELDITSNIKHFKKTNEVLDQDANYKLFNELEAIYKPGSTPITGGGDGGGPSGGTSTNINNQTGSGSALTGDDNPLMPVTTPMGPTIDSISDTSNGGDAPPPPVSNKQFQKGSGGGSGGERRKRAKRRQQRQLASISTFFECLVKQLMDHQENLHRNFLEVMEKRDQERTSREEAWRKQESLKANREAVARAQERALAASRESAVVAFLRKITAERLNLPTKSHFQHQQNEEDDANLENNNQSWEVEKHNVPDNNEGNNNYNKITGSGSHFGSSRWPKAEVQELIQVRSRFESRFQEPGLKGPLWEEVSIAMSSLGYSRSAKRCKEKWENINKYFRKAKDSGKKRPQHSKTCPYFQQLDQLHSKSNANSTDEGRRCNTNSELLDAIVVSNKGGKRNINKEFNDAINEDEDDDDEDGEEGHGESQELVQAQDQENLNN